MNKNRIHKAMCHIESLIYEADRGNLSGATQAREGFAYIQHLVESLADIEGPIYGLMEAGASISKLITEIERAIESEPRRPGLSLGI